MKKITKNDQFDTINNYNTKSNPTTENHSILDTVDIPSYAVKENEKYMNINQLNHFKSILTRLENQLITKINRATHNINDEITHCSDPVDRASQEEEFNLELKSRDRERKLLKKIAEALRRINDFRDYGYCDDCGAEIGIKRLEARPTTTQCIECKTISEIKAKRTGEHI